MPKARKAQICLNDTPYYHCVSRCVRRAFLCGEDPLTGQNYEHRRQWVEDRIHFLAGVFAIDICAYAVMSNHTHVVLHIFKEKALAWSVEEVITRWHRLHKGTLLTHQYICPQQRQDMHSSAINTVEETVYVWRQRLTDISWFMKSLNEYIARQANQEDNCTGHFWEGRFKSQALLDESALAACMAYVELNPVRANMASTPEDSNHTSIQYRINAARVGKNAKYLMPFAGNPRKDMPHGLPFTLPDYISMVDITGRHIAKNKSGFIEEHLPAIVDRLDINPVQWLKLTTQFESCFHHAAGKETQLAAYKAHHGMQRIRGKTNAKKLFG